ncbi:hypothetical protein [Asticcacaulis sp. YBE204]|uniref:hypothetical protein n=1 Tax=Asticcacaulis sp. YBE204 TaxID=1282363 RepID=UPI0003C40782|nr:hypothetical protein [Asticcacaulis sp. YBE204]ESQ78366.1 hypothetical protein AEYBE204_14435 [Asticcacaulis sp. YBE204]
MATPLTRRSLFALTALSLSLPRVAAAAGFTPHGGIKTLMTARQSAVCNIADYNGVQTLVLLIGGAPVEAHARRNGLYQTKDLRRSRSVKAITPVDFNRLIAASGGLDKGVNGTARASDFYALYNSLTPAVTAPDPCPADFAQRSPGERTIIRQGLSTAAHQRYAPCFSLGGDATRLDFSQDSFFDAWTFERDVQGHFYGLSAPGVRAIWSLEA